VKPKSLSKLSGVDADLVRVQETWMGILNPVLQRTIVDLRPLAPTQSNSAGDPGQIAVDATYLYVCTAPSRWVRILLEAVPW
jgi:hypothetical protein